MDPDRAWSALQLLVGRWEGSGVGWFPTIDDFTYREILDVEEGSDGQPLRFNQRSWRITDDGERESHVESGFIAMRDDGVVEMTSAEALDRMEWLSGSLTQDGDGYVLHLETEAVLHDERVIRSWRRLTFDGSEIGYTMGMATTAVPDGGPHLEGRLTRADSE